MRRQEDFDPGADDHGHEPPRQDSGPRPEPRRGVSPKWIAAGIAALVLLIFAVANFERVEVNFLLFSTKARVVTVIIVSGLLGFLAGWFVGRPSRADRKAMRRALED